MKKTKKGVVVLLITPKDASLLGLSRDSSCSLEVNDGNDSNKQLLRSFIFIQPGARFQILIIKFIKLNLDLKIL